ncbi:MAG: T9SS type A sorting domain-containing protein [Bacteroidetes bacterium]|nr:T9SS type A sorting domain-containing protein [Bacteroidota bacterium]
MVKKFGAFLFVLCFWKSVVMGQKEGNVWCFPDSLGIDFNNTGNPVIFTSSIGVHANVNQCTIADSSGNLFCYASALDFTPHSLYIFDRNNNAMPNGSNLKGHPNFTSLLLPHPGIDSLICLLYTCVDPSNSNFYGLYLSRINKNLNSGFGDVVLRDSLIYYGTICGFKLTAVKHANGRDWWIFSYNYSSGYYIYFLLTPNGVFYQGMQNIGSHASDIYYGKLIFSNDGTKMLAVGIYGHIDVFNFDRCTGLLSNYRDIGEHLSSLPYQYFSASFSPDGNLIYISPWNLVKEFYQFDLNAPNITTSKVLLNSYPDTGLTQWNTYNWHNLGPDGKIYIPIVGNYQTPNSNNITTQYLDVIEYPDSVGLACQYTRQAFYLGGHYAAACLPNMPYYGLGAETGSICDSLRIGINELNTEQNGLEVFPNPTSGKFFLKLKDTNDQVINVRVEDVLGKMVFKTTALLKTITDIDLKTFSPGLYFVHVQTEKKKFLAAKIIKE